MMALFKAVLPATFILVVFVTVLLLQHPKAAIYADYVSLMESTVVQRVLHDPNLTHEEADLKAMELIESVVSFVSSPYSLDRKLHRLDMNTLKRIAPQVIALQQAGEDLESYVIIDAKVVPE